MKGGTAAAAAAAAVRTPPPPPPSGRRPLSLNQALHAAAAAGFTGPRSERLQLLRNAPSFDPSDSPFVLSNNFALLRRRLGPARGSGRAPPAGPAPAPAARAPAARLTGRCAAAPAAASTGGALPRPPSPPATALRRRQPLGPRPLSVPEAAAAAAGAALRPETAAIRANGERWKTTAAAAGVMGYASAHVVLRTGTGRLALTPPGDGPVPAKWGCFEWRADILRPLQLTGALPLYDVFATVRGGGPSAQARALTLAIARALERANPRCAPTLHRELLLYEDRRQRYPKWPRVRGQRKFRKFRKR